MKSKKIIACLGCFALIGAAAATIAVSGSKLGFKGALADNEYYHYAGVAATCEAPGIHDYYTNCDGTTSLTLPAGGVVAGERTLTAAQKAAILADTSDIRYVNAQGHNFEKVEGVHNTHEAPGYRDYYDCSRCDKYAETQDGANQFTDLNAWKSEGGNGYMAPGHYLVHHSAVTRTGLFDGNSEYWECSCCDKYYSDAAATAEIAEDSWVLPALKTVTLDATTGITPTGSPLEYQATSKEGDVIIFEIRGGSFNSDSLVSIAADNYFHFKSSLRGVSSVEVTGSGQCFIFSGLEGWTWDNKNVVSGVLSSTPMHYAFDSRKVNNIQFYSGSAFAITSVKINVAAKVAKGIDADGDFTDTLTPWSGSRWDGVYGLNVGMQTEVTNNSKSALRIAVPTVTEGDPWTPICLSLGGSMNLSRSKGFSFDYKLISGNAWSSFKLFNENTGSYVACDWYQSERLLGTEPANEVGINPDANWKTQFVRPITDCVATHILFTLHQVRTAANEEWNEIVIDNFKITKPYVQYETTNMPAWSWRKVSESMAITEEMYAGKSVAIDFKPDGNGTFELTFMSDENHYVGTPNVITVNGESVTSTFGTVTKGADGWYTLAVADAQLNDGQRTSYSSTVACIYLYRDVAPTCNFYVDYASLRAI